MHHPASPSPLPEEAAQFKSNTPILIVCELERFYAPQTKE